MFSIIDKNIILQNKSYLSFPDIIQSKKDPDKFFLTFREGDSHHPKWSNLIIMCSEDGGENWDIIKKIPMNLYSHKFVWNCPRLYYNDTDNSLNIVCDIKSTTNEKTAYFKIINLKSFNEGYSFYQSVTDMPGMVPDKVIEFRSKLYCANHKIRSNGTGRELVQFISFSRDGGKTWYDTNLLACKNKQFFCEGSIVNIKDQYMIAYLRDNSDHIRPLYQSKSLDGINWTDPVAMKVMGQRPTAMVLDKNRVAISFRNTKSASVSIMTEEISSGDLEISEIDTEEPENLYHFGYTGMCRIDDNTFYVVYYIKNKEDNPFIKLAKVKID